jgi:NADH-quinone oxidoreductase subunit J
MIEAAFLSFLVLTIGSALVVLVSRNVLYSAYSLLLTFVGLAALYVLAGADFVAVSQLLVYVGGVLVLLVFGVMLTRKPSAERVTGAAVIRTEHVRTGVGVLLAGGVFGVVFTALQKGRFVRLEAERFDPLSRATTVPEVGIQLMTNYALPFEVAGVLLLAALIGAAYLSKVKTGE